MAATRLYFEQGCSGFIEGTSEGVVRHSSRGVCPLSIRFPPVLVWYQRLSLIAEDRLVMACVHRADNSVAVVLCKLVSF